MPAIAPSALGVGLSLANTPDYSGMTQPVTGNQPPGTVPISQEAWRTGGPGPINLAGQGIYMYGSPTAKQPTPQPLPWWIERNDQIAAQRQAEQQSQVFSPNEYRDMYRRAVMNPDQQILKTLDAARKYEAEIGFANAIKAGVPLPQAMSQFAGMMRNGRMLDQMYRNQMQQSVQPEITNLQGGIQAFRTGPNSYRPILPPKPAGQMTPANQISIARFKLTDIDNQLSALRNPINTEPGKEQKIAALQQQRAGILNQLENPSGSTAPRISTQAEYDKLPSGTVYISKDGKPHKKP